MSCHDRDLKMRNLVYKQGKWENLKKLKVHAWSDHMESEEGGWVTELSVDDNINTINGTINFIISDKKTRHVQITKSLWKLSSCFFKGFTACL